MKYIYALLLMAGSGRAELASDVPESRDVVAECGHKLLEQVGKPGTDLPRLYTNASVDKDTEFMVYVMAMIYVESRFNKLAVSPVEARGLMQLTTPAVIDATKHCNLRPLHADKLFDSYTNVKYGTCYLRKLLDETEGDWTRALIAYNGGYLQLQKYDRGENIAGESANYVLLVNRARQLCLSK